MKLLVLHRIPYHKVAYHRGINHSLHEVTYIGTAEALSTIPLDLRCTKIERPGRKPAAEEILELVKATTKFDRVISLSEYELLDAAKVRESLGVPGPRLNDVELVRNKALMKNAIVGAGLRAPRFWTGEGQWTGAWSGRTVLKPIDGASSEGIKI